MDSHNQDTHGRKRKAHLDGRDNVRKTRSKATHERSSSDEPQQQHQKPPLPDPHDVVVSNPRQIRDVNQPLHKVQLVPAPAAAVQQPPPSLVPVVVVVPPLPQQQPPVLQQAAQVVQPNNQLPQQLAPQPPKPPQPQQAAQQSYAMAGDELGVILSAIVFTFINLRMGFYNIGDDFGSIGAWAWFSSMAKDMVGIAVLVAIGMVAFVPRPAWHAQLVGMAHVLVRYTWRLALCAFVEWVRQKGAVPALLAYHSWWSKSETCIMALAAGSMSRFNSGSAPFVLDCMFPFVQIWHWSPIVGGPASLCEPVIAEPGQCMGMRFGQLLSMTNRGNFWICMHLCVTVPVVTALASVLRCIPAGLLLPNSLRTRMIDALSGTRMAGFMLTFAFRMCLAYCEARLAFYLVALSTMPQPHSSRSTAAYMVNANNEHAFMYMRIALGFGLHVAYTCAAVFFTRSYMGRLGHGGNDRLLQSLSRDVLWAILSALALPWVNAVTFGELDMLVEFVLS